MTAPMTPLQQHAGHAFRFPARSGGPTESRCCELTLGLSVSGMFNITTDASRSPNEFSLSLSLSIETTRVSHTHTHTRTRAINILYISTEILTMAARGYVQSGREKEGKRDTWYCDGNAAPARYPSELKWSKRDASLFSRTTPAKFSRRIASISPRARYRDTCHLALSPPSQSLCCARTSAKWLRRSART